MFLKIAIAYSYGIETYGIPLYRSGQQTAVVRIKITTVRRYDKHLFRTLHCQSPILFALHHLYIHQLEQYSAREKKQTCCYNV